MVWASLPSLAHSDVGLLPYDSLTRTKSWTFSQFGDSGNNKIALKVDFDSNGSVTVSYGGSILRFQVPCSSLEANSSHVLLRGAFDCWFDFVALGNGVKITVSGNAVSSTNYPFSFLSTFKRENFTLWSGSVGFCFEDAKNLKWTVSRTSLSFAVNGSFIIDPSIVANVGLATAMNQQHHNFNDGTNYWCYYQNGSSGDTWGQVLAEYSSDGVTWSNTPVNVLNYTPASGAYPFSLKYYLNATSGVKYVYCAYQKNLTNPSDQIYFRRDTISGTTLTLGTEYSIGEYLGTSMRYSCPDVELNTQGIVFVSYGRLDQVSLKAGYLKVARNTNPSGSGSWTIASWTLWYGSTATERVMSSMTRLANSTGWMYCLFTGYETNGNFWCVAWSGSTFSVSKETVRSGVATGAFFDTSYYGQNVLFSFIEYGVPYTQPHFTYKNESGYWQTEEGFPNRFCQTVTMVTNSSNGDVWFFYEGNESNHVYMIKRSWGGSYSSETDLFSDSSISEQSIIAMINPNGQYLAFQYSQGIPCSSTKFYVYDTVTITKAWQNVTTWTFQMITRQWATVGTWSYQLLTRQWITVGTWVYQLMTRQWNPITTWTFQTVTRAWNTVETWTFQIITFAWHTVGTWTFQILTRQWKNVETWLFQLDVGGWHTVSIWFFALGGASNISILFVGLAFFGSLALAIVGWRMKKRRP